MGQGDRPHFRRRQQALLRLRLQKRLVRVAKQPPADRLAGPVGRVRVANQDEHVERIEFLGSDLPQRAAGDTFVASAKVLADVGCEVIDVPIDEGPRDIGRAALVGRKQTHLLGRANFFENGLERVLGQVAEIGVFPSLHHAGEGELHAADVRHDDEAILSKPLTDVAGQAVEHWVAVDEQHRPFVPRLLQRRYQLTQVAGDRVPLGLGRRQHRERPLGAKEHFSVSDRLANRGRNGFEAVVADANDVDVGGHVRRCRVSGVRKTDNNRRCSIANLLAAAQPIASR